MWCTCQHGTTGVPDARSGNPGDFEKAVSWLSKGTSAVRRDVLSAVHSLSSVFPRRRLSGRRRSVSESGIASRTQRRNGGTASSSSPPTGECPVSSATDENNENRNDSLPAPRIFQRPRSSRFLQSKLSDLAHGWFPMPKNPTGPIQTHTPCWTCDIARIGLDCKGFRDGSEFCTILRVRRPWDTVMILTTYLHATSRTQAALGDAGRYTSVAPSNSHLK